MTTTDTRTAPARFGRCLNGPYVDVIGRQPTARRYIDQWRTSGDLVRPEFR